MNDDDFDLVSAFVDGAVTDAERARVEADPVLLAQAERLRELSSAIGDVPEPSNAARESAIMAALTAFDEQPENRPSAESSGSTATSPAMVAPHIVSLDSRRRIRWMTGLSAAAAVAILAVGGVVISRRSDDSAGTTMDARTEATLSSPLAAPAPSNSTTAVAAAASATAPMTANAAPAPAPSGNDVELPDASDVALGGPATTVASGPVATVEVAVAPGATTPELPSAADAEAAGSPQQLVATKLATVEELRSFADEMAVPPPEITDVLDDCRDGRLVADARYVDDGVEYDVAIVSFGHATRIGALALDRCVVIANTLSRR